MEVPRRPLGPTLEASGVMLELRGVCWRLLGEHFGPLGAASGPLGSARGSIFGAFWAGVGSHFGVSFSRAVAARIELYFAPSPNFFLRFPDFAKMADIAPDS